MKHNDAKTTTLILGLLAGIDSKTDNYFKEVDSRLNKIELQISYVKGVVYTAAGLIAICLPVIYFIIEKFIGG
jgi:tetrahydromethanopterin S-methyltransferase subunit G